MICICKNCGNIIQTTEEMEFNIILRKSKCICGFEISMENSYPPLNCVDFVHSVHDLLEQSKLKDKENLKLVWEIFCEQNRQIDKTVVDRILNECEKVREKYPDNQSEVFINILDEMEWKLNTKFEWSEIDSMLLLIDTYDINKFRKPIIIMIASSLEQLFNHYFTILVSLKLTPFGAEYFLRRYETSGIQSCLDISNSFLDEMLKDKMEKHKKGFYDKWETLRKLRNEIVHNNEVYVTKIKIGKLISLVDQGIEVFSKLISETYKNQFSNALKELPTRSDSDMAD